MAAHSDNQLIDPHLVLEKAQLLERMHVADLGCGRTGHLVFPAALIVGEHGIVYAVDILKDVLVNISHRVKEENLPQIHTVWADIERVGQIPIPEGTLDVAFLVNNLVLSQRRHDVLAAARLLLKDKGRLIIVDWKPCTLSFCPPQERLVDFADVVAWASANQCVVVEEFSVGKHHHGLALYKH